MLSSNLCRCTGYQNIVKAVRAARDEMQPAQVTPVDRRAANRQRGAEIRRSPDAGAVRDVARRIYCPPIAFFVSSTTSFGVA